MPLIPVQSRQPFADNAPQMALTSSQVGYVVKGNYGDPNFSQNQEEISLWSLYSLITEANKSSYIDGFLDRGITGERIVEDLSSSLRDGTPSWYLN